MPKNELCEEMRRAFLETGGNTLEGIPGVNGTLTMYEEPLIGFGSTEDPLWEQYKKDDVVWHRYLAPKDWLPEGKTVISFFFPFTRQVKQSNDAKTAEASTEWTYARVEGHRFIADCTALLAKRLTAQGISCCYPSADPRFAVNETPLASNWSERHCAYVCGLGTFGMSRGLITAKGIAGRFSSLIISEAMEPDARPYSGLYDYCLRCGACAKRCPGNAIPEHGLKDHAACKIVVDRSRVRFAPRYGCGLCQTGVPCENEIPVKKYRDR